MLTPEPALSRFPQTYFKHRSWQGDPSRIIKSQDCRKLQRSRTCHYENDGPQEFGEPWWVVGGGLHWVPCSLMEHHWDREGSLVPGLHWSSAARSARWWQTPAHLLRHKGQITVCRVPSHPSWTDVTSKSSYVFVWTVEGLHWFSLANSELVLFRSNCLANTLAAEIHSLVKCWPPTIFRARDRY